MSGTSIALLIGALATLALIYFQQHRTLHLLQLEHYENQRLLVWVKRRGELVAMPETLTRVMLAIIALLLTALDVSPWTVAGAVVLLLLLTAYEARGHLTRAEIKPLVYTARAKSIVTVAMAPIALIAIVGIAISFDGSKVPAAIALGLIVAISIAPAYWTILANNALAPRQRAINRRFENSARAKLATVAPRVVGITGSYGKTTTKVCIGTVLNEHESTLITPASFNSYLGVIRTINEYLEPEHKDFVVEMGMYRAGDIAELCELVKPTVGVITAIGPMHLERMGTIEAIRDAKAELAQALPDDGRLIVNGDDAHCLEIARSAGKPTTLFAVNNPDANVRAENIRIENGQTHFDLVVMGAPAGAPTAPTSEPARESTGWASRFGLGRVGPIAPASPPLSRRVHVAADLLGTHNVSNLLAAAAVGLEIGMDLETIGRGLAKVQPPEHRLQPLPNPAAGIVVIDDAYNSNPAGAAAALKVLGEHPAARRVLVTPGMVELGDAEEAENENFGRLAAGVCDHVILVGPKRTIPIYRGLTEAGFPTARIDVVANIGGATEVLGGLTRAGDVILFENDLPDLYSEDEQG